MQQRGRGGSEGAHAGLSSEKPRPPATRARAAYQRHSRHGRGNTHELSPNQPKTICERETRHPINYFVPLQNTLPHTVTARLELCGQASVHCAWQAKRQCSEGDKPPGHATSLDTSLKETTHLCKATSLSISHIHIRIHVPAKATTVARPPPAAPESETRVAFARARGPPWGGKAGKHSR